MVEILKSHVLISPLFCEILAPCVCMKARFLTKLSVLRGLIVTTRFRFPLSILELVRPFPWQSAFIIKGVKRLAFESNFWVSALATRAMQWDVLFV